MIKCGNERCSAVETCKFWNNEQCPFFEVAQENLTKKKKPKKEKAPRPKEDSEQQAVIEFCELARIPIVHILVLSKMIGIASREAAFENQRILRNKEREDDKVCKTKISYFAGTWCFF